MNPRNYVVKIVNGRKCTKRRPELCNLTKRQKLRLQGKLGEPTKVLRIGAVFTLPMSFILNPDPKGEKADVQTWKHTQFALR